MKRSESYKDYLISRLKDPEEAAAYLNAAIREGDTEIFMLALRDIVEARGGVGEIVKKTDLNRESLYRTLSPRGNPRLSTLRAVLKACKLDVTFSPHVTKH
jgi:probable addiction module antidote protein